MQMIAEAVEVIAATPTDELIERRGIGPVELQRTRGALRFCQPAQVVAARYTTKLKQNELPVGLCYLAVTNKRNISWM